MNKPARILLLSALLSAAAVTGTGTAAASAGTSPAGATNATRVGAAQGPTCPGKSGGVGYTYATLTCTKGPGGKYATYIECTDGSYEIGQWEPYNPGLWSEADCQSGRVTRVLVLTPA